MNLISWIKGKICPKVPIEFVIFDCIGVMEVYKKLTGKTFGLFAMVEIFDYFTEEEVRSMVFDYWQRYVEE
jgi:hypothetical protein